MYTKGDIPQEYAMANTVERRITKDLRKLGADTTDEYLLGSMTINQKLKTMNYLRSIKTGIEIMGQHIDATPTGEPE